MVYSTHIHPTLSISRIETCCPLKRLLKYLSKPFEKSICSSMRILERISFISKLKCANADEIPLFPLFSRPFCPQVLLLASFIVQCCFRVCYYIIPISYEIKWFLSGKGSVGKE